MYGASEFERFEQFSARDLLVCEVVLHRLGRLEEAAEEQAKLVSLLEETRGRDDAQTRRDRKSVV